MRALVILQDPISPLGPIGERLSERGYELELFEVVPDDVYPSPHVDVQFPDPLDYDLIVPMGAIWAVYDHHVIDWIADELALLRRAHDAGIPILGICFGGQALAAALGGSVHLAPEKELGWYELDSDEPGLIETGPWFEWHQDRFVVPPGARVVARTAVADQAFVIGRSLGLQFHPEVITSTVELWIERGGAEDMRQSGLDPEAAIRLTREVEPGARLRARALVDRFLDQVAAADVVAPAAQV